MGYVSHSAWTGVHGRMAERVTGAPIVSESSTQPVGESHLLLAVYHLIIVAAAVCKAQLHGWHTGLSSQRRIWSWPGLGGRGLHHYTAWTLYLEI